MRDTLQSYYYWYKELPNPDPATFASPEAYLEAVRYRALDTTFSYITSKASSDAFYSDSQFIGYGLSYKQTADTELRLAQTFPGSPAADAGMDRGDTLLSVNGKAVADLLRTGEIGTIFGAEQVGVVADLSWRDMQGRDHAATLTKRLVTIPTVSQTAVLNDGARGWATSTSGTSSSPPWRPSTPPSPSFGTREPRSSSSTSGTTAAGSSRSRSTWRA